MIQTCPVCGSGPVRIFHKYDRFTLLVCCNCDLVFQPQINKLKAAGFVPEIYNADWVAMRDQFMRNTFMQNTNFNMLLINIFSGKQGNLLEIGCGTGEFLFLARESGWNVSGFEPSSIACAYAKQKFGLNLINTFWSPYYPGMSQVFDAVVFWHVLEHIPNPVTFLEEVKTVLKPSGLLFFSVPNQKSYKNTIYGNTCPIYTEPDHFFHYSAGNLSLLVERASLKAITIFSREDPLELAIDIDDNRQKPNAPASRTFEELMALMARMQSNFKGRELFCVALKKYS